MARILLLLFFTVLISGSLNAQSKERRKKKHLEIKEEVVFVKDSISKVETLNKIDTPINVSIVIEHHYPYCGGAYPSDEQMYNYQLVHNSNFLLVNIETGEERKIQTDSTGTLNLSLAPGKYGIKEMYKNCTFEEFLKQYPIVTGGDTENQGRDCYKNWWASYLGEFIVTSPNLLIEEKFTIQEACFTGNNPCIVYMGPWPP